MKSARREAHPYKEEAFRTMVEAHYARVVRYAEGQISDRAAAEDIAAEVFIVAWQKLDPAAPFGLPWLIRTAMHKSRDALRSRYRHAAAMDVLGHAAQNRSAEADDLDILMVRDAMRQLSVRDRQVLELTYWSELSAGEVAQVLRVREGAVWTRLHRARGRLRALLDDEGGERA